MKKTKIGLVTITFFILLSLRVSPVGAEDKALDVLLAALQKHYRTVQTLEAEFVQQSYISSLDQTREFRGKIYLKKPQLLDMEVSTPTIQRQVFDGQFFWIYTPDNNQALKKPMDPGFVDHPLINVLTRMEDLKRDFYVSRVEAKSSDRYGLKLALKSPRAGFQEILVMVDAKDFIIQELTLFDGSGNYTRLSLAHPIENSDIPLDRFRFQAPAGVEVVESPAFSVRPGSSN